MGLLAFGYLMSFWQIAAPNYLEGTVHVMGLRRFQDSPPSVPSRSEPVELRRTKEWARLELMQPQAFPSSPSERHSNLASRILILRAPYGLTMLHPRVGIGRPRRRPAVAQDDPARRSITYTGVRALYARAIIILSDTLACGEELLCGTAAHHRTMTPQLWSWNWRLVRKYQCYVKCTWASGCGWVRSKPSGQ